MNGIRLEFEKSFRFTPGIQIEYTGIGQSIRFPAGINTIISVFFYPIGHFTGSFTVQPHSYFTPLQSLQAAQGIIRNIQ